MACILYKVMVSHQCLSNRNELQLNMFAKDLFKKNLSFALLCLGSIMLLLLNKYFIKVSSIDSFAISFPLIMSGAIAAYLHKRDKEKYNAKWLVKSLLFIFLFIAVSSFVIVLVLD